jgi:periplasmic protein TonB
MKRKNERVPEFDEIIFENRNKNYGAYELRKHYKSVASLSILTVIAFSAILITALSFTTEKGPTKYSPKNNLVLYLPKPDDPQIVRPPEVKAPPELIKAIRNLQPKVVTDSTEVTSIIPITDLLNGITENGKLTDSIVFKDPVTPEIPVEEKIFIVVEENPQYPGGEAALFKFIGENLKYPSEAENNNVQGRVILKFVVNPDGSVGKIEVLRSIDPLLDNEAIRVVKTLPKFRPGKQGGVPVKVWFMLPVLFKIEAN